MKLAGATLTALMIAVLWLLFAPMEIGGRTGYVIVTGNSMESRLSTNDLAIIRTAHTYKVGDVVTYHHPELGMVIHRIIGVDGARFIVQGDNNNWTDSHEPVQAEIRGKLWFSIPGAGHYLGLLQHPAMLAILSIMIGLLVMLPGRKKDSAKPHAAAGGLPTLTDPRGRDLLSLFAVVGIGALIVAGLVFTRPLERQASHDVPYEHTGSFSYTAAVPAGIYDTPEVVSGEPIFRTLTDNFDVRFDYALDSKAQIDSSGTAALRAELSTENGWKRSIDLQAPTTFDGAATSLNGQVDLTEIQQIISRLEAETGVANRQYTLTILPDIAVNALIGGEPVQEHFAPSLAFMMDVQQLQIVDSSTVNGGALDSSVSGLVTQTRMEPNTLSLVLFDVEVARARLISLAVLGLIIIAIIALFAQTLRVRGRSDIENLAASYGPRLIAVRSGATIDTHATVEIACFKNFERLLMHHQGPIFRDGPSVYIDHDGQRYRCGPAQCPQAPEEIVSAAVVLEKPVEAVARVKTKYAKPRSQFAIRQILFRSRSPMEHA